MGESRSGWSTALCGALIAVVVVGTMATAAAQDVDSRHRFQTVRSAHFRFHFHDEARDLVADLVPIAERTWERFAARGSRVPLLTDVVVSDQSESANGFATPLPRNRILMYTAAPAPGGQLNSIAWLEALFVHEFTHIVHLDRAGGWAAVGRRVFGRAPWLFPNLLLPTWQIEGLATLEESRLPGHARAGRLQTGEFTQVVREAARRHQAAPIDRVNGGVTDWPGGLGPYAWGAGFHAFLAERNGEDSLDRLAQRTARSLPWLGPLAFRSVFDASVTDLWREYTSALTEQVAVGAPGREVAVHRLTYHGHLVGAARFGARTCADCPQSLVYSVRTPDERPAIYRLTRLDGDTEPVRLVTRDGGSTLAIGPDGTIYFDQLDVRRNVGTYSDLYARDPSSGRIRRLSRDARLQDPDLAPDGTRLVATQQTRPGARALVLIDLAANPSAAVPVDDAGGVSYSAPRWSPDGRRIVAIRQTGNEPPELVVVDAGSHDVRRLASGARRRWATPAWHPGGRTVIAAAAVDDRPFALFEVDVDTGRLRQITELATGALWPEVSPDGSMIVFTGYSIDGYDLFVMPHPARAGDQTGAIASSDTDASTSTDAKAAPLLLNDTTYRPWRTLLPTGWTPLVQAADGVVRAGAAVGGRDVLGYHAWDSTITWQVAGERAAQAPNGRPDWSVRYAYLRWPLQPFVAAWRRTDDRYIRIDETGPLRQDTAIEHDWEAGIAWPILGYRRSQVLQLSIAHSAERGSAWRRDRSSFRAAWRYSSAYRPGYAISPERGVSAGTAVEFVAPSLGADASGGTATLDGRLYLPGAARHHVVALRAAAATTWGSERVRRVFGAGGGAAPLPGTLGADAAALLRGFAADSFAGRQAAVLNIDYRFPIARPQRGVGIVPALLHSLHASVIADVGHAWSGRFRLRDAKSAVGGELAADVVLGYGLRMTFAGGVAWGRDGAAGSRWHPTPYARVGYAF